MPIQWKAALAEVLFVAVACDAASHGSGISCFASPLYNEKRSTSSSTDAKRDEMLATGTILLP